MRNLFGKKIIVIFIWIIGIIFLPKISWLLILVPKFAELFTAVIISFLLAQGIADFGSKGMTSFANRR